MTVSVERAGAVGWLRIDRPPVNALSAVLVADLHTAVDGLAADPAVRSVVVTGAGAVFSAGADIGEYADAEPAAALATFRAAHRCFAAIETAAKPVLAAVNGPAMGGGLELALACDLRLCAEPATFGMPEARLGGIPCWGAFRRLPRAVGGGWARWLILTGAPVDARQAAAIGLVQQVVPADELPAAAQALAERLARLAPLALGQAKRLLAAGPGPDPRAAERAELAAQDTLLRTRDLAEGLAAFRARRAPRFEGR